LNGLALPGEVPRLGRGVSWRMPRAGELAGERLFTGGLAVGAAAVGILVLPMTTPIGPGNTTPADAALVLAVVVSLLWVGSTRQQFHLPYVIPVGMMIGAGLLAALMGAFPAAGALAVIQDAFLLAWCAAIANVVRQPSAFKVLVRTWSWSAIGWAVLLAAAVALGQKGLAGIDPNQGARAALTFGDENTAALYFVVSLMVVLAAGVPRNPLARVAAAGVIVYAVALTGSLSGLLALVVCLVVGGFLLVLRRRGPAAALTALIVFVLLGLGVVKAVGGSRIFREAKTSQSSLLHYSLGREADSRSEREVLTRETTRLYLTGGIIGRGPASTQLTLRSIQAPYPKEAHDDWIAALVERGVIGAAGLLALAFVIGLRAGVLVRRRLASAYEAILPFAPFLAAALVSLIPFSLTHEILHERTLWTLLGCLAGLSLFGRAAVTEPERGVAR
jgi:hypothetical protein